MNTGKEAIEDLLFSYFSGELTADRKKELLTWLDESDANKKLLTEMADWWATAHAPLFASEMKADFEKHFTHLIKPEIKQDHLWRTWWKGVAVIALLLSVGISSYRLLLSKRIDDSGIAYFETVTPMGAQSKVILPDQSVVWVNAGSSLRYSKNFNQRDRQVYLEGEAYFDVARDTLNPFVVKSDLLRIKVLGTQFNVKAYKEDQAIDVSLISGKVCIALEDQKAPEEEIELMPNRMLTYDKETDQVEMKRIDGKSACEWISGNLCFEEKMFPEIAKDLERKYNIRIHIATEKLKKEMFTGSFSGHYTLDDVLQEVDVEHKYTWKQVEDLLIIEDK